MLRRTIYKPTQGVKVKGKLLKMSQKTKANKMCILYLSM